MLELTGGTLVAGAESSLGFRHGPKAVLNAGTVVVVYVSNDPYTRQYDLDIAAELRGNLPAGSVVTVAAASGAQRDAGTADGWEVPALDGVEDVALALLGRGVRPARGAARLARRMGSARTSRSPRARSTGSCRA